MIVERFTPEHLRAMDLQAAQLAARGVLDDPEYLDAISRGVAGTLLDAAGRPMVSGGVVEFEDGSLLWSFMAKDAGRHMVSIVRAAMRVVQVAKRPVYATAACDFPQACRLLELLGFTREHVVEGVDYAGGSNYVYVRR